MADGAGPPLGHTTENHQKGFLHCSQQVQWQIPWTRMDSGVADFGLVEKGVLCAIMTITVGVDSGSL